MITTNFSFLQSKFFFLSFFLSFYSLAFSQQNNAYDDFHIMPEEITQSQNSNAGCSGNRPSINEFSSADLNLLSDLIQQYLQSELNPNFVAGDPEYLRYTVIAEHSDFGNTTPPNTSTSGSGVWHSDDEVFFSWHRDYIQGLEQFLLDNGFSQFVPLPAWEPTDQVPGEFLEVTPGNGSLGTTSLPILSNDNMYEFDSDICDQITSLDDFGGFIRSGQNPPNSQTTFVNHNQVHGAIGGAMGSVPTASAASIFWVFHAHVDELYHCYQTECLDCSVPFVRAIGRQEGCLYCFDFSPSENVDDMTFELTDANGNTRSIVLGGNGCIDRRQLIAGQEHTLRVTGTNSSASFNSDCPNDVVELKFVAPVFEQDKFGNSNSPCTLFQVFPQFPIPFPLTGGGGVERRFVIKNTGFRALFSISHVNVNSGNTYVVNDGQSIDEGEELIVVLPSSTLEPGSNYLIINRDNQINNFHYNVIPD